MRLGQQIEKDFEQDMTTLRMSNDHVVEIESTAIGLKNELDSYMTYVRASGLDATTLVKTSTFLSLVIRTMKDKVIQLAEPSPDGTTRSDNERIRILESQVLDLDDDIKKLNATIAKRLPPPIPVAGIKGGYKY